jgi:U3 small nucleolar RNA-associated protein 3
MPETLLTYATTLAFYFHLRASSKYALNPTSLRAHPILPRLLVLKQALSALENLDFRPAASDISHSSDVGEGDFDMGEDMENVWGRPGFRTMLEDDELTELLREAQLQSPEPNGLDHSKEKKTKKRQEKEEGKKSKNKKKEKNADKMTKGIFDLVEPEFVPSSSKVKSSTPATPTAGLPLALSAYGEATTLDAFDAQDKSARKRSLRFHTSKIESTAARRARARHAARGGDDDIPYRERDKEREVRLKKGAEARLERGLLGQGGDDLEDVEMESGSEDEKRQGSKKRRREEMEEGDQDAGESGYYELVKRQKKEKKEQKKAEHEAEKAAERSVFPTFLESSSTDHLCRVGREDKEESANGPRSLTRAILKNKGLTPHRSKSVRNPRVKKRQKYEDATKKIRSQKAVYKGGLAGTGGRYEGEASGISVRTVKSVKLG